MVFFWEGDSYGRPSRSRFNLLLLEYGEYFFEDTTVFWYPMPDDSVGRSLEMCDSLKVPGRLKICSRSLIFEPSNHNKPLVKYSFKSIGTDGVTEYVLPS